MQRGYARKSINGEKLPTQNPEDREKIPVRLIAGKIVKGSRPRILEPRAQGGHEGKR
jgi:hypothetical protein